MSKRRRTIGCIVALAASALAGLATFADRGDEQRRAEGTYRSPCALAYSPDGGTLAVGDVTARALVLIDPAAEKVTAEIALAGEPMGLGWGADGTLYVSESGASSVAEVDVSAKKITRRFAVGRYPGAVAVLPQANVLLVTDWGLNLLNVIDLDRGKVARRIPVVREPRSLAVTPDESLAVVGNLLPAGEATEADQACEISLVDLGKGELAANVKLPPGSINLRGVAVSPDGKWAYAVHALGRFTLPTTQLERGWVNTNALSIIDLAKREHYATCLLDRLTEGAADPWGCRISPDGKTLWTSLAGVHELCRVHLANLHLLLEGKDLPEEPDAERRPRRRRKLSEVWRQIKKDPDARAILVNDLAALYASRLSVRTDAGCKGPRGLSLSPDGRRVAAAGYFSGEVVLMDTGGESEAMRISLGREPAPDARRRGEQLFHDGTCAFQHWLSCATCHPDGRVDGLNWDLLNDGIGNPKNTRSLLWSHKTPPVMSLGVRSSYAVASEAGFRFILFREPREAEVDAVKAYLGSLEPAISPYREPDGSLTAEARKGKTLFESDAAGCARCHPAPLFTDLKRYDVGTKHALDRAARFDTPTLVELWRTGPYLHDGSAATLREVLTKHNKGDGHGKTSHLSEQEIDALVEYLRSL